MLKKLEMDWIDFEDPLDSPCIKIGGVPKCRLNKISKEYDIAIRKVGIVEFVELDFGAIRIKFYREV